MKFKNLFKTISICLFLVAITIVLIFGVMHAPDQTPDNDQSASITDTSTQNSNDTTEEDKTIKAVSSATVTVVGDVLPHTNVYTAAYDSATKQYNFDPFFEYVSPYLTKADYSVANLEVTLAGTEGGRTYSGYPRFNCPDSIAASLKKAGFDLAPFKGKNATVYTYSISGDTKNQVHLIVCEGIVIGGDIASVNFNGEMKPLK